MKALIHWRALLDEWAALNTDGSLRRQGGLATCGGLLWDTRGMWLCGFVKKVG